MVARPPVMLRIEPMRLEDLPAVHAIEQASFDAPWPPRRLPQRARDEPPGAVPRGPDRRRDRRLRRDVADGRRGPHHTFAVHPAWRRQRIGERLLLAFLDLASDRGAHEATLEVRLSNLPARRLYEKFGFRPVGLRPRYYSDNGEDALIMTTEPAGRSARCASGSPACGPPLDARARRRPAPGGEAPSVTGQRERPVLILAIESSCDETGIALIEDGRRIRANVVASQVALHAPSGGIVPEVAARAHLRWIVPVLDEAWADAGVDWDDVEAVAVTYGPGLAGSLLVGINFAKALAWVHDQPLVGVNHLEGHVYAAWLRDPGEDDRPEPVFPLVALVVVGRPHVPRRDARPPDLPPARHHASTMRPGEAFDKVGRLLGLGYPGGPAIGRAAAAARPATTGSSRGPGSAIRTTSASPGSRPRPAGSSPRRAPTPACRGHPTSRSPTTSSPSSRGASRTRWSTCSRPRPSGPPARSVRARSCWAAASRPTARCAPGWPARPRRSGSR